MQLAAALLAGGKPGDPLAEHFDVEVKALAPVAGKPMVLHVLEALLQVETIGRLAIVGPQAVHEVCRQATTGRTLEPVEATSSFLGNVLLALEHFDEASHVLLVSADIPLVEPSQLEDFLQRAGAEDWDLVYPIINKHEALKLDPHGKHTFVHTKEGTFTGGNVLLVKSEWIKQHKALVETVLASRKNPFKLASLLGGGIIFKYLCGQVSIAELEKRVAAKLGCRAKAVVTPFAALGLDLDKPDDFAWAEGLLASQHAE